MSASSPVLGTSWPVFPEVDLVEVPSHQDIPCLYGNAGNARDWVRTKRGVLVLGSKKSLKAR